MGSVGERGVDVGIQSAGRRNGVAFDAGDLHQSADGVARQSEVVFEPHLGGILDLRRGAAEELAGRSRSHGAGDAHLALTPYLGARDGGVRLGDVAEEPRRGQRPQDADAQEVARGGQVVEHRRNDAARAARRSRDNRTAGGILLGGGQRIGVDFCPRLERVGVTLRLDPVGARLARHLQTARQHAVVVQSVLDGLAHLLPDGVEVVPDFGPLAVVDILPVGLTLVVAPLLDGVDGRQRVDAARLLAGSLLVGQRAAANAENRPAVDDLASAERLEEHAVGVEGEHRLGAPDDFGRRDGLEYREDGHVGQVALARGGERAVERYAEGVGVVAACGELLGRLLGPHRVAARGAVPDFVQLFERFHFFVCFPAAKIRKGGGKKPCGVRDFCRARPPVREGDDGEGQKLCPKAGFRRGSSCLPRRRGWCRKGGRASGRVFFRHSTASLCLSPKNSAAGVLLLEKLRPPAW